MAGQVSRHRCRPRRRLTVHHFAAARRRCEADHTLADAVQPLRGAGHLGEGGHANTDANSETDGDGYIVRGDAFCRIDDVDGAASAYKPAAAEAPSACPAPSASNTNASAAPPEPRDGHGRPKRGLAGGGCLAGLRARNHRLEQSHRRPPAVRRRGKCLAQCRGRRKLSGYPAGGASCGGEPQDICRQAFQRGALYNVIGTGTYPVWGGIGAAYDALGGLKGYLGYPLGAEKCGLPGGACTQKFRRGTVYYAPGAGTFPVWGAINARYLALGGSGGYLGYPTGAERCGLRGGGCSKPSSAAGSTMPPAPAPRPSGAV